MSVGSDVPGAILAGVTDSQHQMMLAGLQRHVRGAGMLVLSWLSRGILHGQLLASKKQIPSF